MALEAYSLRKLSRIALIISSVPHPIEARYFSSGGTYACSMPVKGLPSAPSRNFVGFKILSTYVRYLNTYSDSFVHLVPVNLLDDRLVDFSEEYLLGMHTIAHGNR